MVRFFINSMYILLLILLMGSMNEMTVWAAPRNNAGEMEAVNFYDLSQCSVEIEDKKFQYTGTEINPKVIVKSDKKMLIEGTDYLMKYSNNIDSGTAKICLSGIGVYKNNLEINFTIEKAPQELYAEPWTYELPVNQATMIDIKGIGSIKCVSSDSSIVSVDNWFWMEGISPGKATITVTASGDKNHLAASTSFVVKVVNVYEVGSGSCGSNSKWTYYNDGTIIITGTGSTQLVQNPNGSYNWAMVRYEDMRCEKAKNVIVNEGISEIGDLLFAVRRQNSAAKMPYSICSINIADSVSCIGSQVFMGCDELKDISIGSRVSSIGDCAFAYCTSLENIYVSEKNPYFMDRDGILYSKDMKTLYKVPGKDRTEYTIPEGVNTVYKDAIGDIESLKTLYIPLSVNCIMDEAFDGTENIEKIYYSGSKSDWEKVKVGKYNKILENTLVIYGEKDGTVFSDVPAGQYYTAPVLWAVKNNITAGVDGTHFAPDDFCTRAQVVTFLWKAKGNPKAKSSKNPFADVHTDDYYYDAVLWAYENGVVSGIDSTHFGPGAIVTRAQFVTFLYRAEKNPFYSAKNPFMDVPAGQYYTDPILWAYKNGVTAGVDSTHFGTENFCTRGQVMTFLYKALNK